MPGSPPILVVGGGIFGTSAARALQQRGHSVTLFDPGPLPHPLAASADISKVCRMEYGSDATYMEFMEQARRGWLRWNQEWQDLGGEPLYHETGVLMLRAGPLEPGGYEYESLELLKRRGHQPQRLDSHWLRERAPAWNAEHFTDGFFHPAGGYAESGRVVEALVRTLIDEGATVHSTAIRELQRSGNRVEGVLDAAGNVHRGDTVVLAAGSWTQKLLPELAGPLSATGHAVFHLQPKRPQRFEAAVFPVFTADISRTGFYGFPRHPKEGVVKIALHDQGLPIDPDAPREVSADHHRKLREFLALAIPELVDAEIVFTRLCLYSDTQDEDFWIAAHPHCQGLVVASGGSGHAFKFAPALGPLIADVVEDRPHRFRDKFRWRAELRLERGTEAARCHDS